MYKLCTISFSVQLAITRMILLKDHPRFLLKFLHRGVERFSGYIPTVADSTTGHGSYKIRIAIGFADFLQHKTTGWGMIICTNQVLIAVFKMVVGENESYDDLRPPVSGCPIISSWFMRFPKKRSEKRSVSCLNRSSRVAASPLSAPDGHASSSINRPCT